jgi:SAM-dependent methyltransferase
MRIVPPFGPEPHRHREVAEAFGADAERYDRARPRYPDALVRRIVATMPGQDVLDVGCGTGIAGLQFQAAGCRVVGVDVDVRMADVARRHGLDVDVAAFESWDPAGREFDAVVSGQTWHWIDPVAGAVAAARVLRPDGLLTPFWNVAQASSGIASAFAAVYRRDVPDLPTNPWAKSALDGYAPLVTAAADGMAEAGVFGEPERWQVEWDREYTRDEWLDQVPTHGGHNELPVEHLEALLSGLGAAIDAVGGGFTMHYVTLAVTAVRTSY